MKIDNLLSFPLFVCVHISSLHDKMFKYTYPHLRMSSPTNHQKDLFCRVGDPPPIEDLGLNKSFWVIVPFGCDEVNRLFLFFVPYVWLTPKFDVGDVAGLLCMEELVPSLPTPPFPGEVIPVKFPEPKVE